MSLEKSINARHVLGAILGFLLIILGFVFRARKIAQSGNYVTGIAFHNPNKKLFESSIKWLKKNKYIFISTEQLIQILKKKSQLPKGAVWITFDDGWKQNLYNALPIIKELNIPVTFFITTGTLTGSGSFWWKRIEHYKDELKSYGTQNKYELYRLSEKKRKDIFEKLLKKDQIMLSRDAMTIDEVIAISKLPQITIGCHTVNHAIITNCTENEIKFEILESQKKLENLIHKTVDCFAYPNGKFNERGKKILKQNGFKIAATSENRLICKQDNELLIPRFTGMDNGFLSENVCHMVGIWEPIINKVKQYAKKKHP